MTMIAERTPMLIALLVFFENVYVGSELVFRFGVASRGDEYSSSLVS